MAAASRKPRRAPEEHPSIPVSNVERFAAELAADTEKALAAASRALLEAFLLETGRRYFVVGQPLVEDPVYDRAVEFYYDAYPDSPPIHIDRTPDNRTTRLPVWMGSLDKIRDDPRRLDRWRASHAGVKHLVSDKLDGVSGLLEAAPDGPRVMTRGNGETGQDVSNVLPKLRGFVVPPPNTLVRGEFILRRDDFARLGKGKNARNVVAGVLNASRAPDAAVLAVLKFVAYEIVPVAGASLAPSAQIAQLAAWGFLTPAVYECDAAELTEERMAATLHARIRDSPYDVDGLVVAADAPYAREKDGNPTHAFAFKTLATHQVAETTVKGVSWEVSKDGYLKPTVLFEPVVIAGRTLQRATGFNAKNIDAQRIGPGARISVIVSGDVIPRIMEVLRPAPDGGQMPGTPWVWDAARVDAMIDPAGPGDGVSAELGVAQLHHFCEALRMKGFGPSVVGRLYASGLKTPAALAAADAAAFARAAEVKAPLAAKLVASRKAAFAAASCVDVMVASNCFKHGFGPARLRAIADAIPDFMRRAPAAAEVAKVKLVGEATARDFVERLPAFLAFLEAVPSLLWKMP